MEKVFRDHCGGFFRLVTFRDRSERGERGDERGRGGGGGGDDRGRGGN